MRLPSYEVKYIIAIHTVSLHGPHVGIAPDGKFQRNNVDGTRLIADVARASGVGRIVFTSTTALYGHAIADDGCAWVDEQTEPQPHTIYHRTKLTAEALLKDMADDRLTVRVIRMSRCFPETANVMAVYRLHRGIAARRGRSRPCAQDEGAPFECYIVSGSMPFSKADCDGLATDVPGLLRKRVTELINAFHARRWPLPAKLDRVYAPMAAEMALGWKARHGFHEVLAQFGRRSSEVLPVNVVFCERIE